MPMTKRDAEKLARENGAKLMRHGSNHDVWQAPNGEIFTIPRHPGDLSPGVEKAIKAALGLE